ncbi:MAG: hypothetical protein WKF55_15705 [Gemmatimonadaceae bacterium]
MKRRLLARGDKATQKEAQQRLVGPSDPPHWEILEGPSCPDVFIQTSSCIVVIEGKFTEPKPTDYTTWLRGRHQMLRHIDAAWDYRGRRAVFGFFIIEDESQKHWKTAVTRTLDPVTIKASLPHRSEAVRSQIASAFLGLTTWTSVCNATGLPADLLRSASELRFG